MVSREETCAQDIAPRERPRWTPDGMSTMGSHARRRKRAACRKEPESARNEQEGANQLEAADLALSQPQSWIHNQR
jgi:hypothetical protein